MTSLDDLARALPPGSGPVGLLSGDEFLPPVSPFDRRLLALTGARVGVVFCADHAGAPTSWRFAERHFTRLGARPVVLDLHDDAPLPPMDLCYLAGGNPGELVACLRTCARWTMVLDRWRAGCGLAGSSAGAMALCVHCAVPHPGARVPTMWSDSPGVITNACVAVHASSRARDWIEQLVATAPAALLALDDRTGVILRAGAPAEVLGEGSAWFADR